MDFNKRKMTKPKCIKSKVIVTLQQGLLILNNVDYRVFLLKSYA
ncbi:hypothetical protein MuYL_2573 [Mucilaginibacter xinganensis]|uniref:Uncharacterized protein n=1 Tax=Mucilaginibacter xinganensis TaxID=1234841 RepID=A0A223NXE2_9SPHI|nr:hypothetical protein MuYL_2573 [Mucilaginibacter xinganensis]